MTESKTQIEKLQENINTAKESNESNKRDLLEEQ